MNPLVRDHPRSAVKSGTRTSTLAYSSAFVRRPSIRYFDRQVPPDRGPRKNEQIRITPIRLVGAEGEQLGIVPTAQALERARAAGLDLVEVAAGLQDPRLRQDALQELAEGEQGREGPQAKAEGDPRPPQDGRP